ncbi:MAG: precorrin-3B C(17)-methyltransferase, partial [Geminicoccaceae bacterium]|nr:precorrin-3B C(17)-methyltransferase [Geminicoccaceae bacterium]
RPIRAVSVGRGRGRLALVGLGPGDRVWRTAEVDRLLQEATHLVGYRGYLDLVEERPGQARHAYELGEEVERCRDALELAAAGHRVALVCSGDPGIFAMAAPVVELIERGEHPAFGRLELLVSPGVSALQAAAARVGAPLGHDFCAISLSDLLTPWTVIERRLQAAAEGDFVTVLFNPASGRRRQGLIRALEILARSRPPATPVILARKLGRAGEAVSLHTLGSFDPDAVDMLSLVIVGARSTRIVERPARPPLVVTPRGYPSGGGG